MSLSPSLRQVEAEARIRNKRRRQAEPGLVSAIQEARRNDHTLQEIADVLGCSRQAVSQLLGRH